METDYYPKGWLRILDLIGMVFAPISISLPLFFSAILLFLEAGPIGIRYYEVALVTFLGALGILIVFGSSSRRSIKSYVSHQATRDDLMAFRVVYFGLILASHVVDFMFLYAFFFRHIS